MNIEKEKKKMHTGSILLMIIALFMIYISISKGTLPPGLTGAGFLIMVWMKEEKEAIEREVVAKVEKLHDEKEQA